MSGAAPRHSGPAPPETLAERRPCTSSASGSCAGRQRRSAARPARGGEQRDGGAHGDDAEAQQGEAEGAGAAAGEDGARCADGGEAPPAAGLASRPLTPPPPRPPSPSPHLASVLLLHSSSKRADAPPPRCGDVRLPRSGETPPLRSGEVMPSRRGETLPLRSGETSPQASDETPLPPGLGGETPAPPLPPSWRRPRQFTTSTPESEPEREGVLSNGCQWAELKIACGRAPQALPSLLAVLLS